MNNLGYVNFWGLDLTKQGKKTLKTFSPPYDFSSMSSACLLIGSCAELVSMPSNEPSSLIADSWLRTPIRAPSSQLSVHVRDFKHMDVLFARLLFAVTVHAWRSGLSSGRSKTFRCWAGSDEEHLRHEDHPGQGAVRSDLRLAETGRVEAGKAFSLAENNVVGFASSAFTYSFRTSQGIWQ